MIIELFLGFLKVGCFSFGGAYATIPLIRDIVLSNGWLSDEMFTGMIAIAESTPGPIMVNLATYIGTLQAGFLGAIAATFAVVFPSFLIVLIVALTMSKIIGNPYVQSVLKGIKPAMAGIILATGIHLILKNLMQGNSGSADIRSIIIAVMLSLIFFGQRKLLKRKISPITLIIISAVFGIVGFGI